MPCRSDACAPSPAFAPPRAQTVPLALRHVHAAQQSLDAAEAKPPSPTLVAHVAPSLALPQYRRTFVQGCACSTGFAGGGCCPSGVSGIAWQTGCGAHSLMGLVGGAFGALGLYGGVRVVANSADALGQIHRVQQSLAPQLERLALLEAQARAAKLPVAHLSQHVQALGLWTRALGASAREQWFNFWVPGVLQAAAASCAMCTAGQHAGWAFLGPVSGAWMGIAAPFLLGVYGVLLAGKHLDALWRAPDAASCAAGDLEAPEKQAFAALTQAYAQARRTTLGRTAWAWGLVGTSGVLASLAAAGICAVPLSPMVLLGLSMAAAGFAMWQNSQSRYVPHLPVSPHVTPQAVGASLQRQKAVLVLAAQDQAIKQAAAQLHQDAPRTTQYAHRLEALFRPQCGPTANRVLATFVGRTAQSGDPMQAARHTRLIMRAAISWCTQEIILAQARLDDAKQSIATDVQGLSRTLVPSCQHRAAGMHTLLAAKGPGVHNYNQAGQYLRDEAQGLEAAAGRLAALQQCLGHLQALHNEDMQAVLGDAADVRIPGPAQTWLYTRLHLLLLSGTLGDAVDKAFIVAHNDLFSQLTSPEALPIHNVYIQPAKLEAFATLIAPHLDDGFVHAFLNPRRIEAEIDYLLELEAAVCTEPNIEVSAPACTGETCCR